MKNKTIKKKQSGEVVVHKYPSIIEWLNEILTNFLNSRNLFFFLLIIIFLTLFFYYPTQADDFDIWFHLSYGKDYVKNFTAYIDHSKYSWTTANPDWNYVTWLGSSVLYIAYFLGGAAGLYILKLLLIIAIAFLYFLFNKNITKEFNITHLMILFLSIIALNLTAIYVKPELFSTLFFYILVFSYFYIKIANNKKLLFFYPIMFLIWTNTHGGWLIGIFYLSVMLILEILNFVSLKKDALDKNFLINMILSVVLSYCAICINPYGYLYPINTIKYLLDPEYGGQAQYIAAYLKIWGNLFDIRMFRFSLTAWSLTLLFIASISSAIYVFAKNRFLSLPVFIVNIIFYYFSMDIARASMFYLPIAMATITYNLFKSKTTGILEKNIFKGTSLVVIIIFSIIVNFCTFRFLENRYWLGFGLENEIPIKESEFILKNKLPTPIFNDYIIGGYVMWSMYPEYKVWIDSRQGPYINSTWVDWVNINTYMSSPDGLKRFNEKYPFKVALIHMRENRLIFWMLKHPEWKLLYFDKSAVVIIHKSIIPTLSQEALNTDVSTVRFNHLTNPRVLRDLFNFYIYIGPSYAEEILNIYSKNVSNIYKFKDNDMINMKSYIEQRKVEFLQK